MFQLKLNDRSDRKLTVLCLGCHSDDIEIGCGGSILRLREQFPSAIFSWVVFSAVGVRKAEARRGAELFAGTKQLRKAQFESFRDGFMPYSAAQVKQKFEKLKEAVSPDLIFTHNGKDAHQDHRLISQLTWNTFRDHLILEYEIPKYDGDLGQPNVFIPLPANNYKQKVQYLSDTFKSQRNKRWFEPETFLSLMRLRGMECNSVSGHAEAFYCRKLVL